MSTLLESFRADNNEDEVMGYISEKYSRSLEFYGERIADSDYNEDTVAEQVDGAVGMILSEENSEWGHLQDYSQELVEMVSWMVYDMIAYPGEE